jgi:hypothetical protein
VGKRTPEGGTLRTVRSSVEPIVDVRVGAGEGQPVVDSEPHELEDAEQKADEVDSERRLDPSFVLADVTGNPEAKRKWPRRRNIALVLAALVALWTLGGVRAAIAQHAVPFTAYVDSEQCSAGHCTVFVHYTQPNGETVSYDVYSVSQRRIHSLPSGQRVLTLYWFPKSDGVDTETGFWIIIGLLVGGDLILSGLAFAVLYSAKRPRVWVS